MTDEQNNPTSPQWPQGIPPTAGPWRIPPTGMPQWTARPGAMPPGQTGGMPRIPFNYPRAPFSSGPAPWASGSWPAVRPGIPGVANSPYARTPFPMGMQPQPLDVQTAAGAKSESPKIDDTPDPFIKLPTKLQAAVSEIGIVGIVLSVIAFAAAFFPEFAAIAIIVAAISMVFGVIALIGGLQKSTSGRWMPIVSLSAAIAAIVIAMLMWSFAPAAPTEAVPPEDEEAPAVVETSKKSSASEESESRSSSSKSAKSSSSAAASGSSRSITARSSSSPHSGQSADGVLVTDAPASTSNWAVGNNLVDLPVGTPAECMDDMAVCLDTVTPGLINFDGTIVTCITVAYINVGDFSQEYHEYNWKAVTVDGDELSPCYYTSAQSELGSGKVGPGEVVTGNIYYEGMLERVTFSSVAAGTKISWLI